MDFSELTRGATSWSEISLHNRATIYSKWSTQRFDGYVDLSDDYIRRDIEIKEYNYYIDVLDKALFGG